MKTIKVSKAELLSHLRTNREVHVEEYNIALVEYRNVLIEAFKDALKRAKNHEDIRHAVNVERPVSYVESYDTIIKQLEWTLEDSIELDQTEFRQYIQDEWIWKDAFAQSTSSYIRGKK